MIWNYSSTEESCEESGGLQFHRLLELLQTGHKGTLDIIINNYQKNNKKGLEYQSTLLPKIQTKENLYFIQKSYREITEMYAYMSSESP